jgi:hypothetical protein
MKNLQAIDIQKQYKTDIQITKVANHNLRVGRTPDNVDPSKSHLNKIFYGSWTMDVNKVIEEKLEGVSYRKDAVKTAHMEFSVSSQWFDQATPEQIALWEQNTLNYVKDMFGEQNIVYAVTHYDEETPHMHICAVPLVDNKLNFKKLFNGKKGIANNFHTKYNEYVKELGIERGERFSKAKRTDIKAYTARLKQSQLELEQRIDKFVNYVDVVKQDPTKMGKLFGWVKNTLMPTIQTMKDKIRTKDKELVTKQKKIQRFEELLKPICDYLQTETPSKTDINTLLSDLQTFKHTNTLEHSKNIANVLKMNRAPEPKELDCDSNKAANSSTSIPAPTIKPKH